jgi:Rrf2 family transcriptional regulator, iron-sulfur cluster assembly transcription factor
VRLELTSRSSYAIRAVLAIARAERAGLPGPALPVPMSRIADEMAIPRRFLPQVMGDLVRAGIVNAQVGRAGGYLLVRSPAHLSVLEVIEASEGDTRRFRCVLRGVACGTGQLCEIHAVVEQAQRALRDRLQEATIADVLDGPAHTPAISMAAAPG